MTRSAGGHLAFGHGPHTCLGAPLARLEGRILFEKLARRGITLTRNGEPTRKINSTIRGYASLPVSICN
ncbi:cytochrome P450 [Spirillospora sp. NPDC048819]|uniref:cytochrome P450 n=1 Tax=Spirillospora sp. NPDC048819 TaxID=3155268 RepID=UPI0033C0BE2E